MGREESFGPVTFGDLLEYGFGQRAVGLVDMLGNGDEPLDNQVYKGEEDCRSGTVITQIDLTGMHGVVADHTDNVECLLNLGSRPARTSAAMSALRLSPGCSRWMQSF